MKHIKRFNEEFFYPEKYEPLFSMEQLEGAFLSARVVDQEGEPRFENFREWYMSELGSSVDMRDYAFDKHTKSPFNQYSYIF